VPGSDAPARAIGGQIAGSARHPRPPDNSSTPLSKGDKANFPDRLRKRRGAAAASAACWRSRSAPEHRPCFLQIELTKGCPDRKPGESRDSAGPGFGWARLRSFVRALPFRIVDGGVNPRKSGDDRKAGTRFAACVSMRSITPSDCILHSAISARCSSRINTPCRRSNQQLDPVHPQGRTPMVGQFWIPIDSLTHRDRGRAVMGQLRCEHA
jgi:hypothetical protein